MLIAHAFRQRVFLLSKTFLRRTLLMRKFFTVFACVISLFIIITVCPSVVFTQDSTIGNQENGSTEKSGAVPTPTTLAPEYDEKNELSVWGGFAPDMPRVFGGS